jgi:hypothetical protein
MDLSDYYSDRISSCLNLLLQKKYCCFKNYFQHYFFYYFSFLVPCFFNLIFNFRFILLKIIQFQNHLIKCPFFIQIFSNLDQIILIHFHLKKTLNSIQSSWTNLIFWFSENSFYFDRYTDCFWFSLPVIPAYKNWQCFK